MAQFISASVGRMGGRNLPEDVVKVQQLLNNVPIDEGGPLSRLVVDSLCGPRTIDAIQKFQLHHFGWHGADGRVDPDGPTLAKLNEFDGSFTPVPVTIRTGMHCPHGGRLVATAATRPPLLTTSDQFAIEGCPLFVSPCVTVRWLGPPGQVLTTGSVGLCLNAVAAPTGIVLFS